MAQGSLPIDLDPSNMNIQRIEEETEKTINFLNVIETVDINNLETNIGIAENKISELENIYNTKTRIFFSSSSPSADDISFVLGACIFIIDDN